MYQFAYEAHFLKHPGNHKVQKIDKFRKKHGGLEGFKKSRKKWEIGKFGKHENSNSFNNPEKKVECRKVECRKVEFSKMRKKEKDRKKTPWKIRKYCLRTI